MRIIFDNNIWISFLIGKRLSALRSVFSRKADYLVSGDSDLLELKEYNQTKIVEFETVLGLLS